MTLRGSLVVTAFALGLIITPACRTTDTAAPTADEAHRFVDAAEKRLEGLSRKLARAAWVQNNFITVDTQQISAEAQSDLAAAVTELALGARRFEGLALPQDQLGGKARGARP
jgi:peptidyl-dipeptidase A